jgi:ribonuclease P protein component
MTRVAAQPGDPPRVAFAIGRPVGSAVVRNRIRRRLRALCRTHAGEFAPGHSYLIGASPQAGAVSFADLETALRDLLARTASAS